MARTLADFFVRNSHEHYASQADLWCGRAEVGADGYFVWSSDAKGILEEEFFDLMREAEDNLSREHETVRKLGIVLEDDTLIALVILSDFDAKHGGHACIEDFVVSAEHRSEGLGSKILHLITHHTNPRNFATVCVDVNAKNERARAFFEREGFRPVSTTLRLDLLP